MNVHNLVLRHLLALNCNSKFTITRTASRICTTDRPMRHLLVVFRSPVGLQSSRRRSLGKCHTGSRAEQDNSCHTVHTWLVESRYLLEHTDDIFLQL